MRILFCHRCADTVLHDGDMCTKCAFKRKNTVSDEEAVRCPCCYSWFYAKSKHSHDKHQTSLPLPPIVEPKFCDACGDYEVHSDDKCVQCLARTTHPEVSGEEEVI